MASIPHHRLEQVIDRFDEVEARMGVATNPDEIVALSKEHSELKPVAEKARELSQARADLKEAQEMIESGDAELAELAREELPSLKERIPELESEVQILLLPKDEDDKANVILEVRAGTGGDEAALFAGDLFRMYHRHADRVGWQIEQMSASDTPGGGFKEIIALVSGTGVFRDLKYERGVHRVQRVPATESQGRVHTSTVTVAVMPEAEEVDVEVNPNDLRIDVMRARGPGGQSVNTTDSAVRITHLPTGLVVQCQDEKSQHKNKAKAMKVLLSRLLELEQQRTAEERANERRQQVGTGERSEKIRTYNYAQNRVTDHRASVTLHKLEQILEGNLDELLSAIRLDLSETYESADPQART